jgi:Family of unknown function (DUF6544)
MNTVLYVVALACLLGGAAAVVALVGRHRFRGRVAADVTTLFSNAGVGIGSDRLNARWDALPEPVRRYLRYAIREGASAIRTARLRHDGLFRTTPEQRWFRIEGEQYFTVTEPGFVWNASIRPAPFFWIEARDRLVSGRGSMLVKLVSTIPIADAVGPEIDQGSRLRWLAEGAWFPYAFVGDQVQWEPIDAHSARVRPRCDGLPVSALVEVDDEGKLTQMRADRFRDVGGGKAVLTPWRGRFSDYREFNGFRVPSSVEVTWELEKEPFSYVRFRVTALEYNVAHRFS